MYRMRVDTAKSLYIGDYIVQPNHLQKVYKLFADQINSTGKVYVSTNNYSKKGELKNLDTAYKFYHNLSWWNSDTIGGGTTGSHSFINYYDNIVEFPRVSNTTVYVRHIDITGIDELAGENMTLSEKINQLAKESTFNKVKVGFAWKKTGEDKGEDVASVSANRPGYQEKFFWEAKDLEMGNAIGIYNKLFNENTLTCYNGVYGIDNNNYKGYSLVSTVVSKATSIEDAEKNRDDKYNNNNNILTQENPDSSVILTSKDFGNYIVIDFLYKKPEPQVYIRHIDTTGIPETEFKSDILTNYLDFQRKNGKAINKVGFAGKGDKAPGFLSLENTIFPKDDETYPEYEHYTLKKEDFNVNRKIRFYNKLYNNSTKWGDAQKNNKTTLYDNYLFGYTNNIKCVVAQGNDMYNGALNRNIKIDNEEFFEFDNINNKGYIELTEENIQSPYIFIDFYYREKETITSEQKLLVRHINISTMETVTSEVMNSYVNSGTLGHNVFDGYDAGLEYTDKNQNKMFLPSNPARGKILSDNNYYNEIYELGGTNTTYKLYNEFYNSTQEVNYEYIGYIMNYNNYSLALAELSRDKKISNANFKDLDTLDGTAGDGYLDISSEVASKNAYIVVDMYYKEKAAAMPIRFPGVRGRLSFDSVLSDFETKTDGTYDVIPSDEEMNASITGASKYLLGGIRIVPMNINNTQKVEITVNIPCSYSYTYWSGTECSSCDRTGGTLGTTCGACTERDEKTKECTSNCSGTFEKVYTDGTGTETISKTFTYEIPYDYSYYKVSNMRLYKIDYMELYDSENDTDLPLFGGNTYKINVSDAYRKSVDGTFTSSASSQILTDNRGTIVKVGTENNLNEKGDTLKETVTINVDFGFKGTFEDKEYTSSDADSAAYNMIKTAYDDIERSININNAMTINGAYTSGKISNTTSENGAKVQFKVSNDKITMETLNNGEDLLSTNNASREVSSTIKLYNMASNANIVGNTATYKDLVDLDTTYPNNVQKQYGFTKKIDSTDRYDFNQDNLSIPMSRLNGERVSKAKIYYKLLEDIDVNFDSDIADVTSKKHDWKLTSANTTGSFTDTEMNQTDDGQKAVTNISTGINLPLVRTYDFESSKTSPKDGTGDVVNIFTPVMFKVSLDNGQSSSNQVIVDHTTGEQAIANSDKIIQKDTRFTITIKPENNHDYYGSLSGGINKYIKEYYIKFNDLDVQEILINETSYRNGRSVAAGTWIGPIENIGDNTTISAIAKADPNSAVSVLEQDENEYVVRGVTKNATNSMLIDLLNDDYSYDLITENSTQNRFIIENVLRHTEYYVKNKLYNDNDYVAETTEITTTNLSRLYDFKVTDVKDLDWKSIFRKSNTTTTNIHSGIVYYSGVNKWNIYTTTFKDLIRRTSDEIGSTSQRILPVGPYKSTNSSYVYAPKLGYRFSFDFKTTGKIQKSKSANIDVSFMFIDKTFGVSDSARIKEVDLYYKNSSNKYVKVGSSSDKTSIYFVPNDGYRLTYTESTYNFNKDTLSTSTTKIGTLTNLKLTSKMRAVSDNEFSQIWYGEYKLPNSTIAVEKGVTELNNDTILKNGYIAVKFDITVTDTYSSGRDSVTISYSQNDKAAPESERTNTSQWDYEGYLGFSKPGNVAENLKLRLDSNVIWTIDNDIYNRLKGTVILYDADNRASSDYN